MSDSVWTKKGATLSDKSARKEFGLTQEEIIEAIKGGKLQYRNNYTGSGSTELTQVDKELKRLKAELGSFEKRKVELLDKIGEYGKR